jgi:hypothetical protein
LIAAGHPPEVVWNYTPRQIHAYHYFAERRQERQWRKQVLANAVGSRGTDKALDRALKE